MTGLDQDYFVAPASKNGTTGTRVKLDKDGDAAVTIPEGSWLKTMGLYISYASAIAAIGLDYVGTKLSLSTSGLMTGSVIKYDGVEIGKVSSYAKYQLLEVEFYPATTEEALLLQRQGAEALIRSMTYTNLGTGDASPGVTTVTIEITDRFGNRDEAGLIHADRIAGAGGDDVIYVGNEELSLGDEVIGGDGYDSLWLFGGGIADLAVLSKFEGIEVVYGSEYRDEIRVNAAQVAQLTSIQGGGQAGDALSVAGEITDLRGKDIGGFTRILFTTPDATIIMDDVVLARMISGFTSTGENLIFTGSSLSDEDRFFLHMRGIDNVTHGDRTTVRADIENKTLKGTSGKNVLKGALGDDKLYGGNGNDVLAGGYGKDVFVFNSKLGTAVTDRAVNFDSISDFNMNDDTFWLDNAIFKKLGVGSASNPGKLSKAFFKIGTKAKDKNDFLLYNKSNGYLSYDADGTGTKYKAIEFAKVTKGLSLTADDFRII